MKIFGIGLNKTGTTTLRDCLLALGYSVKGFDRRLTYRAIDGDLDALFESCGSYDAFQDFPWPLIYRQLDERYPGSKFVLTTRRNSQVWLDSQKRHAYHSGPRRHRRLIYGYEMPHRQPQAYIERYERHNAEVRQYFRDRPGDLLEVCWETGSTGADLCRFLGQNEPESGAPVPHSNPRGSNRTTFLRQCQINWQSGISLLLNR